MNFACLPCQWKLRHGWQSTRQSLKQKDVDKNCYMHNFRIQVIFPLQSRPSHLYHWFNTSWMIIGCTSAFPLDFNLTSTGEKQGRMTISCQTQISIHHTQKVMTVAFKVKSRDPLKNRKKQNQEELTPPPQHNGPDRSSAILINQ